MQAMTDWRTYDYVFYAFVAIFGTAAGLWAVFWVATRSRWAARLTTLDGVVPPFINIIGVLFGLTLAFLANDTWSAHDRAMTAIYREAGALHGLKVLASRLPQPQGAQVGESVRAYASAAAAEWPRLARREQSADAARQADALLAEMARPDMAAATQPQVLALMLSLAHQVSNERDSRISLSQIHVNPLKWLGMALLGLLTMLSVAATHLVRPRAMAAALVLFAASAGPTAAIVLVQANPFQAFTWVSPAPFLAVAGDRAEAPQPGVQR